MKQFILGFSVASILWLGALYSQSAGYIDFFCTGEESDTDRIADAPDAGVSGKNPHSDNGKKSKRKKKRFKGKRKSHKSVVHGKGETTVGDDLGSTGGGELDMGSSGGEGQLSSTRIEQGIDSVFNGIQRCLVLVPSDMPASGKVVLGMHIASSGRVTKVNLKGPGAIIRGESGACIRRVVKSIDYPSFDGPDMIAHYPIVFD
jgi:hypothetical protein